MLLNEPTPHQTRPAAASAPAAPSARELPAVEVDGATAAKLRAASSAEADTVAFTAVEGGGGADSGSVSGGAGGDADGSDATDAVDTVALDVAAVKRAMAESIADAATVSLNVAAVKEAVAEGAADEAGDDPAGAAAETETDSETEADSESILAVVDTDTDIETTDIEPDEPSGVHLASTDLSTTTSTLVAVPETADDVIATIHAAATLVAAADLRARQAAVTKPDPWTGLDLHQPPTPAPVDNVLDLLAPVLQRPLLVVEQPGLPKPADVVALHRSELEVDFVEPPVVAAGAEPPIPPRYGPGLSVLPHIEFPV